jgi:mRNA-degrading endonuclease YafQ of YafQ-DinJ toxin-antitoxin module
MQKSRSLVSSYHEDLCNVTDECLSKNDEEQMKRKLKTLSKRQEQLLRVAFYMLLNIADNVKIEEKMHKKDIVGLLIGAMERHSNIDLLILIVSFLQKLSIFVENKNSMASRGIIEKLTPLLDSPNADLVNVTLKLTFNLTFDTKLRNKMIKMGLLPKFIQFTSKYKVLRWLCQHKNTSLISNICQRDWYCLNSVNRNCYYNFRHHYFP